MRYSRLLLGCVLVGACNGYDSGDTSGATSTGTTDTSTTDTSTTGTTGTTSESTSTTGATTGTTSAGTTTGTSTTGGVETTSGSTTGMAGFCGDGVIDPGEACDGLDFGDVSCVDFDPQKPAGMLVCAGDCASIDASKCEPPAPIAIVRLNEITSSGALAGPWMGKGDLIEIYNAGDAEADLSMWKVAPDQGLPLAETYVFPPGSKLAPKEWLVLSAYDMLSGTGDFMFGISKVSMETVVIADADDALVDLVDFSGADATVSYCRAPDGNGVWVHCDQTFGAANVAAQAYCGDGVKNAMEVCDGQDLGGKSCQTLGVGYMSGSLACTPQCALDPSGCKSGSALVINEVESTSDKIELYNSGDAPVDVSGMILTDNYVDNTYNPALDGKKMIFVPQTVIGPKQYLTILPGVGQNQHPFGLSSNGDSVTLLKPDVTVLDAVLYAAGDAAVSYCRLPDGPAGVWTAGCTPTFGTANKP